MSDGRKSVGDIIIEKFIEVVDKEGKMPWQMPYNRYLAFNWYSMTQYHGINRLILPIGEYLSMNQMITYNKKHGTNYRYDKTVGPWWSVVFFKTDIKSASDSEMEKLAGTKSEEDFVKKYPHGVFSGGWLYYVNTSTGCFMKKRNILRYTNVAERSCFIDDEGKVLPSRYETGDVQITKYKPKDIFDRYVKNEGISTKSDRGEIPCYIPKLDLIVLNPLAKSEDFYWSYAFHEASHSTGVKNRLNREFFKYIDESKVDKAVLNDLRSKEECIAEISASMLCSECDIVDFNTSECDVYKNSLAYVESWKRRIKDWGNSFIYIVSEAEKAYQYIMGESN